MKTCEFDFILPEKLIAQKPILQRDSSGLMIVDRNNGGIEHKKFCDIISYLNKGDVLVLNDTKVLPARLLGFKEITNANVEVLLLENKSDDIWKCLVKHAKRIKVGDVVSFGDGVLKARCLSVEEDGIRIFEFIYNGLFYEILDKLGSMPLPPYIREKLDDKDRYQTVYAKNIGSAAAPTAGLHFTEELLRKIKEKGVIICYITLHVGLGTFRPVSVDDVTKHKMHSEFYSIDDKTALILNKAKRENRRIISVGTTTTRTLETVINKYDKFCECSGFTDIFIYPGYKFRAIDGLITNFHLPKSTLLMLVSAFSSKEIILNAYQEAINAEYRFFSFGDAMFLK